MESVQKGKALQLQLYDGVAAIAQAAWPAGEGAGVFVGREWLAALEETGCVGGETGWRPLPLALERDGRTVGLAPAYLKQHNRGEYVFDWSWSEAYARSGLDYYPKLVVASPFTPVTGSRLLGGADEQAHLIAGLRQLVDDNGLSSAHVLFPTEDEAGRLREAGWLLRDGVQFHWRNRAYADFDDFLATLSRDKRKKIRQERRKVAEAEVAVRALSGGDIASTDWELFFRCYRQTYLEHGSLPYLNLEFFRRIGERLAGHCVMFIASREGRDIAASLCVRDGDALYGRYWGALEEVPCLHFELCYYQGLEYAIRQGLETFEGGAQGEHKQARGFEPERTVSAHYIADPRFRSAIADWLRREREGVADYVDQLFSHSAYKTLARDV